VERFEPVVVDGETIERLIDAADPVYRLEFVLMGHLALRWGKALGVGVGHVNDGQVLIRQHVIENREVKPARVEISTCGGKTVYAKRDLYASARILEAARGVRAPRRAQPVPAAASHADRLTAPREQLAAQRLETGRYAGQVSRAVDLPLMA